MLSLIITYHNEGLSFLMDCINQIRDTIDTSDYEIIVMDDCSDEPLPPIEGVEVIRNKENVGVGASFDTGVDNAKGENIILLGCDIRFIKNQWASLMVKEIEDNPKSITCSTCLVLWLDNQDIAQAIEKKTWGSGATIGLKGKNTILDARWLIKCEIDSDSHEVPCLLGAFYGVKKSWYKYVDGFALHSQHSTLEPMISIKSYLMGGSIRVAPRVVIGHIFRQKKQFIHRVKSKSIMQNKVFLVKMITDDDSLIQYYGQAYPQVLHESFYDDYREVLQAKRKQYKAKTVLPFEDYITKFNLK